MAEVTPPERILLVEGVDDKHVVRHLCDRHQDMPPLEICELNGFQQLKAAIGAAIRVPGRRAPGILADSDADPIHRWKEIAERLSKAGGNPG